MMVRAGGLLLTSMLWSAWLCAIGDVRAGTPVHGARAAGMNTAFTAVADDPSAILHNPAGITRLEGTAIYGGGSALFPVSRYRSPAGESVETRAQVFFPPHLFLTHSLQRSRVTVGVGVYAPFGVGGRLWPDDGPTRYSAIESYIATQAVNPALAVILTPALSLAAGIDYVRAKNFSDTAVDQSMVGAGDARLEMEADGDGWGYNLGLMWQAPAGFSLGLTYRSEVRVDQKGHLKLRDIATPLQGLFGGPDFRTAARGSIDLPASANLGIAWRPGGQWVIDLDVEWTGWSSFQEAGIDLAQEVPPAGLTDITIPQDWRDVWAYKLGADCRVSERISLRAGYAFLNTPVPEATLTPAHPDADQHNVSLGFGWHYGPWIIDGYYNYGRFMQREVDNTLLFGTYDNTIHYLGLSLGYWH